MTERAQKKKTKDLQESIFIKLVLLYFSRFTGKRFYRLVIHGYCYCCCSVLVSENVH